MSRLNNNMLFFMGEFLWFNKLQIETLYNIKGNPCSLSQLSFVEA